MNHRNSTIVGKVRGVVALTMSLAACCLLLALAVRLLLGVASMTRMRGADNRTAKAEFDWRPASHSWRDGFSTELAD